MLSLENDRAKQTTENGDKHGCYCLSWSQCKNTGTDPNIYVMKDGASARIPPLPFKITWIGSRSGPVGRVDVESKMSQVLSNFSLRFNLSESQALGCETVNY